MIYHIFRCNLQGNTQQANIILFTPQLTRPLLTQKDVYLDQVICYVCGVLYRMIINLGYSVELNLEVQMDTYTKTMVTIITVCVVLVTLLLVGSLIFEGHDHDDEHDYGYVEELYEKLEYISHRIEELEERLEE